MQAKKTTKKAVQEKVWEF